MWKGPFYGLIIQLDFMTVFWDHWGPQNCWGGILGFWSWDSVTVECWCKIVALVSVDGNKESLELFTKVVILYGWVMMGVSFSFKTSKFLYWILEVVMVAALYRQRATTNSYVSDSASTGGPSYDSLLGYAFFEKNDATGCGSDWMDRFSIDVKHIFLLQSYIKSNS